VKSNAVRLSDLNDRVALDEIAERKLADRNADIAGLVAGLGSEGRRVYALLANRDPDKVPELIAALPDALRDDLVGLDLKRRDLANPPSRLYLVHGRDDAIVPYTESEALAAAVHGGQARLFLLDSLAHVDVGPSGLLDAFDMLRAVYGLLTERDAMAPPRLPVAAP
jgi:fermentation-respiration switch protein FrsA (DUF1100 family)